ncbi:uncharacterized protein LOC123293797 [Chrysoperla carnea]|uniref:uncharacterized protein LOC123293797 n=1 Tax=Chrysoperla carnea TaxID=189513 RepID=UPI001D05FB9B|nr:uncharacterized protein LOC123293797 [Chrysoperla carnea]
MNTENQNNTEQGSGEVILFKNKDVTDNNSEKNDSDISIGVKNENGDFLSDQKMESDEPITPTPSPVNSQHSSNNIQRSIYNPCMADTHSRIFGDSDDTPQPSPRKNSTVTFRGNSSDNTIPETIEKAHFYGKKTDGNPLTGEGYDKDKSHQHGKMPPGGHSTPLW